MRFPWVSGFSARLYWAFAGIALLTLIANGFALYLFHQFGRVVDATAGEAVPEMVTVMRLTERSALLAAVAPVLAAARSQEDLAEVDQVLANLLTDIRASVEQLTRREGVHQRRPRVAAGAGDPESQARRSRSRRVDAVEDIRIRSEEIVATLAKLRDLTRQRLVLQALRFDLLAQIRQVQGELVDTLNPVVYGVSSLSSLFARRDGRQNAALVRALMDDEVRALVALLELQAAAAPIHATRFATEALPALCARMGDGAGAAATVLGAREEPGLQRVVHLAARLGDPGDCTDLAHTGELSMLLQALDEAITHRRKAMEGAYRHAVARVKTTPVLLANDAIRALGYAMDLKAEGNLLVGLLTAAAEATDEHTITHLSNRYRSSLQTFRGAVEVFTTSELARRNPVLARNVPAIAVRLSGLGAEGDSLFTLRRAELTTKADVNAVLDRHRQQATAFTARAAELVQAVQGGVADLQLSMAHARFTGVSALLVLSAAVLALTLLIALVSARVLSHHETELRAAKADAEQTSREMEAFTYSVSHDLRAPLRTLDGFSQALVEDYGEKLDADARTYLGYLQQGSREMGQLIDGLLLLSRSSRGELHCQEVDLSAMAQAIGDELARDAPGQQVSFTVAPGLRTWADSRLLRVVMENLLGNAWKYSARESRSRITVGVELQSPVPTFWVRDNGAGFDPAYRDKLFQPFQRLHNPDEFEGTGIGLATVQRIVHRHGGEVWAGGAPGEGATFYFTLPDRGTER